MSETRDALIRKAMAAHARAFDDAVLKGLIPAVPHISTMPRGYSTDDIDQVIHYIACSLNCHRDTIEGIGLARALRQALQIQWEAGYKVGHDKSKTRPTVYVAEDALEAILAKHVEEPPVNGEVSEPFAPNWKRAIDGTAVPGSCPTAVRCHCADPNCDRALRSSLSDGECPCGCGTLPGFAYPDGHAHVLV